MTEQALQGIRVVECAEGIPGPYCGRLLAGMGAEVIKVEPPVGDAARRWGPFPPGECHPEKSAVFLYNNVGKLGVTLDIESAAGHRLFRDLVATAQVLIEDRSPGTLQALGLGYDNLSASNPALVVTSITPYGQTGPYKDYKATHLNLFHAGGEGYMIPGGMGWELFPDRPPLQAGGCVGYYDAGLAAACATLTALHYAEAAGTGQHVDVSIQEVQLALNRESVTTYTYANRLETRATRAYSSGGLLECKDGYVFLQAGEEHFWKQLVEFMGTPEWTQDPRLETMDGRRRHWDEFRHYLREWAKGLTQEEIIAGCRARGLSAAPYAQAEYVLSSEQMAAREFFIELDHPAAGALRYPTAAFQLSEAPWRSERPAPLLGQHNGEVLGQRLGLSLEELTQLHQMGIS